MPRRSLLLGRNCRCSYPHPPLRHPQVRCKGCVMVFSVLSFVIFTLSWDRPGWEAKGSLQRAAARGLKKRTVRILAMIYL